MAEVMATGQFKTKREAVEKGLRARGRAVRSPIDVRLASYCMRHGHVLLHRDANFGAIQIVEGLDAWPH